MAIYASSVPVFDLYRDDDGVYILEMTPGMLREMESLFNDGITARQQRGQWVSSPCVAVTRQLENAVRAMRRDTTQPA